MMDIETGGYGRTNRPVFDRLEGQQSQHLYVKNQVCKFWLAGQCNRNPCRFLHSHSPNPQPQPQQSDDPNANYGNKIKTTWRNPNISASKNVKVSSPMNVKVSSPGVVTSDVNCGHSGQRAQQKLCQYWVTGNCVHGDKCKDLHSWFSGSGLALLTKLERHNKAVTGVALPCGSDKLFSGSKDESVCLWDCNTGQCVGIVKPGGEIGCLISEGPWVFVGLQNAVMAWNIQTQTELLLRGPVGLVKALVVGGDMLFGGAQDGSILVWKSTSESCSPEPVAFLMGHRLAVLSLVVGANCLYSGSKDESIRVWDLKTLQCLQILNGHKNFVTSVLCWDKFLLSGSLDNRLKVWAATEFGDLEVVNEVEEDNGILALCGIHDAENKPILLCSCKDNSVCLYDLPSFAERGRIYAQEEVQTIAVGCGPLFFTGGAAGELSVWKLHGDASGSVGCS
ncbi:zinc finger CCCH domain-containing protein 48-like isoform X4 [Coffea eugenioides]|uniref:zinc finger CCCH domain-containing protein 48-like isoform X4 n=1 Tax=Coffea eugenioides TaxID=49369 RepID=UPI000F6051CE|nr:zinc finger CCCH domain-containing protein 48-like isoform X4 [Coffea eugenioides]